MLADHETQTKEQDMEEDKESQNPDAQHPEDQVETVGIVAEVTPKVPVQLKARNVVSATR